jgi:hypothetical protein
LYPLFLCGVALAIMLCMLMAQPVCASENTDKSAQDMEKDILHLLSDSILDATGEYYGLPRLYWPDSDKLLSIRQVPNTTSYEVVLQVVTFLGPHNPPYGMGAK